MNLQGGDTADTLVRMLLSGAESGIRLTGAALKNALAFTVALAKRQKRTRGKTNLQKLQKQGDELRVFPMKQKEYTRFKPLAKKYGITFAAVRDKKDMSGKLDIMLNAQDVHSANHIFKKMGYGTVKPSPDIKKNETRSKSSCKDVSAKSKDAISGRVSVKQKLENYRKQTAIKQPSRSPVRKKTKAKAR